MIKTDKPHPRKKLYGDKWRSCVLCGNYFKRCELYFDSGSTVPTVGETLTGATSTDTMVVTDVDLISGSWAGGDAVGVVQGSDMTGRAFDSKSYFQDDELINGSTAGNNCLTANGTGAEKIYGRLYPEREMVFWRGKWYCNTHWGFRWRHKLIDEENFVVNEEDRGRAY